MSKATRVRAARRPAGKRQTYHRSVKLTPDVSKAVGVDRIGVVVYAEPMPLESPKFKRGVYCFSRNGKTNQYGVVDSRRRQIGLIANVPEQPSGWSRINDRGAPADALMDLVLFEAYRMLSRWEPNFTPSEEESRMRAVYRGMGPYGRIPVTHEGTLTWDTDNYDRRTIEVIRDRGAVTVELEYCTGRNDLIELNIGGDWHQTGRGLAEYNGNSGIACFFVADVRALENLYDALGVAIARAKEQAWPAPQ